MRYVPGGREVGGALRINMVHRFAVAVLAALMLGIMSLAEAPSMGMAGATANASAQKLSPEGESVLRKIVDSAHDTDLRWPDFPLYRDEVSMLYEESEYALVWIRDGRPTPQALAISGLLRDADEKGLVAEDYDGPQWEARLARLQQPSSDPDLARFDAALTVSAMRYIRAMQIGRVNPKQLGFELDVEGREYDLSEFLRTKVVNASDPVAAINEVESPFLGYRRALDALRTYRQKASQDDGEKLPSVTNPVVAGESYPGVPRLIRLLRLLGDLPASAPVFPDSKVYGGPLVTAVKAFQGTHGLNPNGHLDAKTVEELNTPLSARVRQIELTLERWRWLPHALSSPPVVINLPEFRLRAMDEQGREALQRAVIVGKAYEHQSPVLMADMKYVVFRPYWEVPAGILQNEIVPRIEKDRNYISAKNFEVVTQDGNLVTDGPISDEVLARLKASELRVRQKPGPTNSLGLVKLIFPNEDNVYMHGTDAPGLFSQFRRDFSHGCIRVQNPGELAAWALRDNPGWSLERVEETMNGSKDDVRVNLAHPIPVLIIYGTAAVDEEGRTHFFEDIYGYDVVLEKALAMVPYP